MVGDSQKKSQQNLDGLGIALRRRSHNNTPVVPSPGNYQEIAVIGKADDHSTVLKVEGQHYSAPIEPIQQTQDYPVNLNYANISDLKHLKQQNSMAPVEKRRSSPTPNDKPPTRES